MAYTEIQERNKRKYYYRVLSIRKGNKISKKRKYLGFNLSVRELADKEEKADKELDIKKEDKKRIIKKLKQTIIKILKKNKIKKAGMFGSYARGEQKKNSDIDIIVEPPKGIGFAFAGIQSELEKKLKKRVDLVTYKYLSPYLKKYILKEEVRIIWENQ